jgi:hypothetical protein
LVPLVLVLVLVPGAVLDALVIVSGVVGSCARRRLLVLLVTGSGPPA